jgi:hypothetical protein
MKLTAARLLETGKLLGTKAGKELADLIAYVNDTSDEIIRALRQGLTFADNFNCQVTKYSISNDTEQIIFTNGKTPIGIIPIKVVSMSTGVDEFAWWVGNDNQTRIKVGLTGAPSASVDIVLVILF